MKSQHTFILTLFILILGCSKDDVYGYSIPKDMWGTWLAPEQELGSGEIKRTYQYVFTQNNIVELINAGGGLIHTADFNKDFPEDDWEIVENIDGNYYEIIFTPKHEGAITPWGTNLPFRRAFIHSSYNGVEAIILDYPGATNALLYRK